MNDSNAAAFNFLVELRSRLISSLVVLFILFAVLMYYANDLYTLLALPLLRFLPEGHLIATQIVSPFFVPFKLAFMAAMLIAAPYFLYQVWGFIAPALYGHERRWLWPFLLTSALLFYAGIAFAYLVIFPMLFHFLAGVAPAGVVLSPDISEYLDFTIKLLLVFGGLFEIPMAMVVLVSTNVITRSRLIKWRSYAIVGAFVLGMLLAPPDVLSQTILAVPIWLLYEVGILMTKLVEKPLVLLDADKIQSKLASKNIEIAIFKTIGSTNDYAKQWGIENNDKKKIFICLAEEQTQGRGRLERTWHSPYGQNIYLSCLFSFEKNLNELAGLSLVAGLALAKTLNAYTTKEKFTVKWPNDILCEQQKVAGCLIETQAAGAGTNQAIIGMGVNVNMLKDSDQIDQAWTSLGKVTGKYIDRNELCAQLINHLISYCDKFRAQGLGAFTLEWERTDSLAHQSITLMHAGEKIQGVVTGINEQGHLLLRLADGEVRAFTSGDASVVRARFR